MSVEQRMKAMETKATQIINPKMKCFLCGDKIVNDIMRKEKGITMFYGNPEALALSKLLCDKHMRNAQATGYEPLTKEQWKKLSKPFNDWHKELAKQVMQSGDKELIAILKGKR